MTLYFSGTPFPTMYLSLAYMGGGGGGLFGKDREIFTDVFQILTLDSLESVSKIVCKWQN